MSIILPKEQIQVDFEQLISQAWHEAHGTEKGRVYVSWGEDRVVVVIEEVLLKGERLLAQSEPGRAVLERYVYELIAQMVEEKKEALSQLLQRQIVDSSASVNASEQWIMIIFRLAG